VLATSGSNALSLDFSATFVLTEAHETSPSGFPRAVFGLDISPTPLPAALPLFAAGLGGLGLLGWRRKRKAQVSG